MDQHAITELDIYITNDGDLYRSMTQYIEKNMRRKWEKGVYSKDRAVKGWLHLAVAGAKAYHAEFCGPGNWYETFPPDVRLEVAKRFEERFRAEMSITA